MGQSSKFVHTLKVSVKTLVIVGMIMGLVGLVACGGNTKRGKSGGANEPGGIEDSVRFYGGDERAIHNTDEHRLGQNTNTYFFGYDRYEVTDNDLDSIYSHAADIAGNPNSQVRIEGHTDERGSAEYNIALAQKRADSVASALISKGVPQNRLNIVSYGKEKPANTGHDESAWSENRRAMIVYEGR